MNQTNSVKHSFLSLALYSLLGFYEGPKDVKAGNKLFNNQTVLNLPGKDMSRPALTLTDNEKEISLSVTKLKVSFYGTTKKYLKQLG